ncbi:hypothetical protein [Massilia sp. TSP1-1-2]|uniref:hypothetical protein n=1 Tax=unclassified Massilia TaxID=2609279 RepID=UPI003CFB856C
MKKLIVILLVLLTACSKVSSAPPEQPDLEAGLIKALSLNPSTRDRLGDSGQALQAYIKAGYLDLKPAQRADYTDYRVFKKPATLMGHTLVIVEEEYMTRFIGCCVSPGVGVTVRLSGSSDNLEKFADKNGCAFIALEHPQAELSTFGIKASFPKGKYASLSCRERDALADPDKR